jgi:hypothetical protein
MDIDRYGLGTFTLMAHGKLIPDSVCVLKRTMVIMNDKVGAQMCNLQTLGNIWQNAFKGIYKHMQCDGSFNDDAMMRIYADALTEVNTFNHHNRFTAFFDTCPNISLGFEKELWRDGLWKLPMEGLSLQQIISVGSAQRNIVSVGSDVLLKPDAIIYPQQSLQDFVDLVEHESNHVFNVIILHACTGMVDYTGSAPLSAPLSAPIKVEEEDVEEEEEVIDEALLEEYPRGFRGVSLNCEKQKLIQGIRDRAVDFPKKMGKKVYVLHAWREILDVDGRDMVRYKGGMLSLEKAIKM